MEKRELTKRQEWRVMRDWHQSELNEALAKMELTVEYWNLLLADADAHGDTEKVAALATEAIEALDNEWQFHHDFFMVSGKWYYPKIAFGDGGVIGEHVYEDAFASCQSNGFIVDYVERGGQMVPRVGMSFIVGTIPIANTLVQGTIQPLAFAEPHEISLSYMRPGSTEVVSSDLQQIGNALERAESILRLYLSSEHSSFFRQSEQKQQVFFMSLIEMVEETLPDRSSLDALVVSQIELTRFYYKTQERAIAVVLPPGQTLSLGGTVIGVTILEHLDHVPGTVLRSKDDMIDSAAQICLIVQTNSRILHNGELVTEGDIIIPLCYATTIKYELM
ncbi:MAG: hypothetical protein WBB39_02685 [Candidatus Saccharimonadales bacterium]